jgi:hypothetical protein
LFEYPRDLLACFSRILGDLRASSCCTTSLRPPRRSFPTAPVIENQRAALAKFRSTSRRFSYRALFDLLTGAPSNILLGLLLTIV